MKNIITIIFTVFMISCTEQTNSSSSMSFSYRVDYKNQEFKGLYLTTYNEKNSIKIKEFSGVIIYPKNEGISATISDNNYIEINNIKYDLENKQIALYNPQLKTLSYFETKLSKTEYPKSPVNKYECLFFLK